jgi:hypothetical protein
VREVVRHGGTAVLGEVRHRRVYKPAELHRRVYKPAERRPASVAVLAQRPANRTLV